jgi:hypothetical protein
MCRFGVQAHLLKVKFAMAKIISSVNILEIIQDAFQTEGKTSWFEGWKCECYFESHGDPFAKVFVAAPILSLDEAKKFAVGLRLLADALDAGPKPSLE